MNDNGSTIPFTFSLPPQNTPTKPIPRTSINPCFFFWKVDLAKHQRHHFLSTEKNNNNKQKRRSKHNTKHKIVNSIKHLDRTKRKRIIKKTPKPWRLLPLVSTFSHQPSSSSPGMDNLSIRRSRVTSPCVWKDSHLPASQLANSNISRRKISAG